MTTMEEIVGLYVRARDRIKEIEKVRKAELDEELAPWREAMDKAEGMMMTMLNTSGADSMKTSQGTAYKSPWTKAVVRDWQQVLDYAVENERFDLFERRVAKTVVEEIGSVPGVEIERGVRVNVRRS